MQSNKREVRRAGWHGWLCSVLAMGVLIGMPLGVQSQSQLWSWGWISSGQLGDGTTTDRCLPLQVGGLTDVVAIAASAVNSLVFTSDGTMWAWGANWYGQLGDGTTIDRSSPVPLNGPTDVVAIAASGGHSLALTSYGRVWAWGANDAGQLGDGTTINRSAPVPVSGLTNVVAIAAGGEHSLALRSDGTLWAWGGNWSGQLGDGTEVARSIPVAVSGLTDVVAVACGLEHSLALRSDGTAWAWGRNYRYQIGDGTTIDRSSPVPVSGLTNVVALAGGGAHSLAVRSDGTVWGWGDNYFGQLGDGTNTNRPIPGPVSSVANAIAVAAGQFYSLALKADGTVWAWGYNQLGQLGDGAFVDRNIPVAVNGLTDIVTISAGRDHNLALQSMMATGRTALFVQDAAGYPGQTVVLTTCLWANGVCVAGKAITIRDGATVLGTVDTDSRGVARILYTIPDGTALGRYTLTAAFAGDSAYLPTSRNFTISVRPATIVYTNATTGYPGQSVDLAASLQSDGIPLPGKAITFTQGAKTIGTATTDSRGVARLAYTIPAAKSVGRYTLTASFAGDTNFAPSSPRDLTLTVAGIPTIAYANAAHGYPGRTLVLTASLWAHGTRLSGKTITFTEGATTLGSATTDNRGVARLTYTLPNDSPLGDHTLTAAFAGDTDHLPCRRDLPLTVSAAGTPMPTATYTNAASGSAGQTITLVASLWSDGVPLGGKTITFADGATTLGSATTDDRGIARFTYTIPQGTPAGSHPLAAAFAGDADFLPSTGDLALTVVGG